MLKSKLLLTAFICTICISLFFSCRKQPDLKPIQQSRTLTKYDTILSLAEQHTDTAIWKCGGQFMMVTREASTDEETEIETGENDNDVEMRATGCSNTFAGSARAAAKKSYATGANTSYTSIGSLRASMQSDAFMRSHGITTSSPRITQENRNVTVTNVYLYAISRESDNDFHMIIGDSPVAATHLLNCECGGLPATTASSYSTIKAVRDYIKAYFGTDFCGTSGYTHFSHPIHVSILKGSLFYDIDHAAGTVGPAGYRANTSWEIHPISSITFN